MAHLCFLVLSAFYFSLTKLNLSNMYVHYRDPQMGKMEQM